jgi:hypothetical protein
MKTRETLKEIIDKKNFKTFWHCYEFLTIASYSPMEAFSASVEHFGLDKLFDNVAFFRTCDDLWVAHSVYTPVQSAPPRLIIGIINENNKHLTEFYKIYHKQYSEGEVSVQRDIEESCEVIKIYEITPFITNFVMEKMFKNFGIDGEKKFKQRIKDIPQQAIPRNLADVVRRPDNNFDPIRPYEPVRPYNPIQPRQDNIRYLNNNNDGDNNRA